MKKYFVTGAGGFIGSALVKKIAENGDKVFALVFSENERRNIPDNSFVTPIIGDLNEYEEILSLVNDDVDLFYHLAWMGISSGDYKDINIQKNNIELTINSVKLAERINTKKYVFVGSNQEYLVANNSLDGSITSASIYGVCKACSRRIAQTICKDKILFNSTAFTNVFGVGDHSKRTANLFIRNLSEGKELNLIEGNNLYDWTYIDDAVNGLIAVGNAGLSGKQYYIGHRKLITFKEIICQVRDIIAPQICLNFGKYSDISYTDYSNFDLDALYMDTGFECQTDFKESILKTAEWVKSLNWEV